MKIQIEEEINIFVFISCLKLLISAIFKKNEKFSSFIILFSGI
nr:hypothetical protein [Borreliella finlandensis]